MKEKNRCPALSPGAHLQCEKKKGHVRKDDPIRSLHRCMLTFWSDEEGLREPRVVHDETHSSPDQQIGNLREAFGSAGSTNTGTLYDPTAAFPSGLSAAGVSWSIPELPPVPLDPEEQLRHWWFDKANAEVEVTVPKAIEYGSTDLLDIGLMLARTVRRTVTEEEAAELGVFFYLIGKIARWQSAIERGERPSDDTLLDIGIYVRMAQRIRDAGAWPGVETL